jgi:hypothetical protein
MPRSAPIDRRPLEKNLFGYKYLNVRAEFALRGFELSPFGSNGSNGAFGAAVRLPQSGRAQEAC